MLWRVYIYVVIVIYIITFMQDIIGESAIYKQHDYIYCAVLTALKQMHVSINSSDY